MFQTINLTDARRCFLAQMMSVVLAFSCFGQRAEIIDSLKAIIPQQSDTLLLASIMELDAYLATRDSRTNLDFLEQGLATARELGHLYYESEMLNLMGTSHYYLGDYDRAVELYHDGLEVLSLMDEEQYSSEVRIPLLHSTLLMNIGVMLKIRGVYQEALEYYQQSLNIRQRLGNKSGLAIAYVNIGNLHVSAKSDNRALEYFKKAEELYRELEEVYGQAAALNNMALIYRRRKELTTALGFFERALDKYKSIEHSMNISRCYTNIGLIYHDFEDYDRALDYFALSQVIKNELEDRSGIAANFLYMADTYTVLGQLERAVSYYNKAIEIYDDLKSVRHQLMGYQGLADVYAELGDYANAYLYKDMYVELNATLQTEEIAKQLAAQEARYASSEREKELAIKDLELATKSSLIRQRQVQLWILVAGFLLMVAIAIIFIQRFRIESRFHKQLEEQNEELRRTYDDLKATVVSKEEKEAMVKEIHHRVKNNLQIISSLINLQANVVDDLQAERMLREVQSRVLSMAMLHEQLYKAPDVAGVSIENYLRTILDNLLLIFTEKALVRYEIRVEVSYFSVDTLIPLGLLVNEVVTNSLKYAFKGKDSGLITIALEPVTDKLCKLVISDDGVGFDQNSRRVKRGSIGMELIETFVSQMDGEMKFTSENGTRLEVEFAPILRKETDLLKKTGMPTA